MTAPLNVPVVVVVVGGTLSVVVVVVVAIDTYSDSVVSGVDDDVDDNDCGVGVGAALLTCFGFDGF